MITSYYDFKHYQCPWRVIKTFFWVFCFMIFFWISNFFAFFGFFSFFVVYHCSSVFTLSFTFVVCFHLQVEYCSSHLGHSFMTCPGPIFLLIIQINGAVTDGAVVNLEHLASWWTRQGLCTLVIKISLQRAPWSISHLKLLLQESL